MTMSIVGNKSNIKIAKKNNIYNDQFGNEDGNNDSPFANEENTAAILNRSNPNERNTRKPSKNWTSMLLSVRMGVIDVDRACS